MHFYDIITAENVGAGIPLSRKLNLIGLTWSDWPDKKTWSDWPDLIKEFQKLDRIKKSRFNPIPSSSIKSNLVLPTPDLILKSSNTTIYISASVFWDENLIFWNFESVTFSDSELLITWVNCNPPVVLIFLKMIFLAVVLVMVLNWATLWRCRQVSKRCFGIGN